MKRSLLLLAMFLMSQLLNAQIYGNAAAPDYGSFGANYLVFFKIETGPSDSGNFTHFGFYDHPTSGQNCDVKLALYSDHPSSDLPDVLLGDAYVATPTNGIHNQVNFNTPVALSASTTYWIGIRVPCNYGNGRVIGQNWAIPPYVYKTWSFNSAWPAPAGGGYNPVWNAPKVSLWVVGNGQILPVEMLSFEAKAIDDQVQLTWEVATEVNNEGWNIQRSTNGFSWETIGWQEGQFNSLERRYYQYTDDFSFNGRVFYRLEQVDASGEKVYSEVSAVQLTTNTLAIFPNPCRDEMTLSGVEPDKDYSIYNSEGKLLMKGKTTNENILDVSSLQSGKHFLKVGTEFFPFVKI